MQEEDGYLQCNLSILVDLRWNLLASFPHKSRPVLSNLCISKGEIDMQIKGKERLVILLVAGRYFYLLAQILPCEIGSKWFCLY